MEIAIIALSVILVIVNVAWYLTINKLLVNQDMLLERIRVPQARPIPVTELFKDDEEAEEPYHDAEEYATIGQAV